MKLKDQFVVVDENKGFVSVSTDTELFSGMIRGNETAAFIMKCLQKETNIEQITERVCSEYEADPKLVREDVEKLLSSLRKIGALDE